MLVLVFMLIWWVQITKLWNGVRADGALLFAVAIESFMDRRHVTDGDQDATYRERHPSQDTNGKRHGKPATFPSAERNSITETDRLVHVWLTEAVQRRRDAESIGGRRQRPRRPSHERG